MITNAQSGTNVHEIADGIYRINTPVTLPGGVGQFSFNQYLIVDDAPMLFHTGLRQLFPVVSEAISAVLPIERLRYIGLSHFEADECGALNLLLEAAPASVAICSQVAAMVSVGILQTAHHARWPMGRTFHSAATRCVGSTPLTCRTRGNAHSCSMCRHEHSSAAICSRRVALEKSRSQSQTFWARARVFARRWITSRMRPHIRRSGAPGARVADDACLHARQCLARRWRQVAAGVVRGAGRRLNCAMT